MFLFVKHPIDIGDRVEITGAQMVVEHISLLHTVFRRIDSGRRVQIGNMVLAALWIENFSRSEAMKEQLDIKVSKETSQEDIEKLRAAIQAFVSEETNKRDYQSDVSIDISSIGDFKDLTLKVEIKHKSNWANENLRSQRRNKFMIALLDAARSIPILASGEKAEKPETKTGATDSTKLEASIHAAVAAEKSASMAKSAPVKAVDAPLNDEDADKTEKAPGLSSSGAYQ